MMVPYGYTSDYRLSGSTHNVFTSVVLVTPSKAGKFRCFLTKCFYHCDKFCIIFTVKFFFCAGAKVAVGFHILPLKHVILWNISVVLSKFPESPLSSLDWLECRCIVKATGPVIPFLAFLSYACRRGFG